MGSSALAAVQGSGWRLGLEVVVEVCLKLSLSFEGFETFAGCKNLRSMEASGYRQGRVCEKASSNADVSADTSIRACPSPATWRASSAKVALGCAPRFLTNPDT